MLNTLEAAQQIVRLLLSRLLTVKYQFFKFQNQSQQLHVQSTVARLQIKKQTVTYTYTQSAQRTASIKPRESNALAIYAHDITAATSKT